MWEEMRLFKARARLEQLRQIWFGGTQATHDFKPAEGIDTCLLAIFGGFELGVVLAEAFMIVSLDDSKAMQRVAGWVGLQGYRVHG